MQLVRSFSGDNLLFYVFITPWRRLQQGAEWAKEETKILHWKVTLPPMILEKFAFSFAFNLRRQHVKDFLSSL